MRKTLICLARLATAGEIFFVVGLGMGGSVLVESEIEVAKSPVTPKWKMAT
jgi:hypothetical protein